MSAPFEGDPTTAADDEAARLEAVFDRDRLEDLVAMGGEDNTVAMGGEDQHTTPPSKDIS